MTKMMKCAIYNAIKNVTVEERPIPKVSDNDVLIKVLKAGICGSDVGIYFHGGENYGVFPGSQFGHEFVGIVVEKGKNVSEDIKLQSKVFVDPVMSQPYGVAGSVMAGAFSEYALVSNAKTGVIGLFSIRLHLFYYKIILLYSFLLAAVWFSSTPSVFSLTNRILNVRNRILISIHTE